MDTDSEYLPYNVVFKFTVNYFNLFASSCACSDISKPLSFPTFILAAQIISNLEYKHRIQTFKLAFKNV